jgi:MbtH protein
MEVKVMSNKNDEARLYRVVINHEEQYSIWPTFRENPRGWSSVGKEGTKDECLAYIKEVWTDMRPASLRRKMDEAGLSSQ